jgi:peptidoglycan/xylan/chitin deacetylase (PgdA/CDA1 family)
MNKKSKISRNTKGYAGLCYHYIRPDIKPALFPDILGNTVSDFHNHIKTLSKEYQVISPDEAYKFSYEDFDFKDGKYGLLFTFDDGLSDQYIAARTLSDYGIKGIFFVPTCILKDKLPPNPMILHYGFAKYRVEGFLHIYRRALEHFGINISENDVKFERGKDNPWKIMRDVKDILNYKFSNGDTRKILLHIYENSLLKDHPDVLDIMHLTREQIKEIAGMGHHLGAHTDSHISVAASELSDDEFEKEIVNPKKYLEDEFGVSVTTFSYPFGRQIDCLSSEELIKRTKEYKLAFTIEKILNTKKTSPFELGRYTPYSTDTDEVVKNNLREMINADEN